jgi:hypothetical protein
MIRNIYGVKNTRVVLKGRREEDCHFGDWKYGELVK